MDLIKAIRELRREKNRLERVITSLEDKHPTTSVQVLRRAKDKLERVIASLEGLRATVSVPAKDRRGRRSMSPEERREISERMKRYWEDQHKQRRPWS